MRPKRVLAIGVAVTNAAFAPADALGEDGMLIVMDGDASRLDGVRRFLASAGIEKGATIIAGDPRRMLHKLAGPFDTIFCGEVDPEIRAKVQSLLAPGGILEGV